MPTDMMGIGNYAGILTANAGLEDRLSFSQYNSLEYRLNLVQAFEPEDPPEPMYTTWGVWRHRRDPLHSIEERYDTKHVVRKGFVAEDILHNAHYVPVIGEEEHREGVYKMAIEYNDEEELKVYNTKINLGEYNIMNFEEETHDESVRIPMNEETEDNSTGSEGKNIGEKPEELNSGNRIRDRAQKNNFDLGSEKELTKIFEKYIKNSAESGGV